jgi:hypothetical protein
MNIIGKRQTDNALLMIRNHKITDVRQSLQGTISIDVSEVKHFARWRSFTSRTRQYRGGYQKIGRIYLFLLTSDWSITQSNGAVVLKNNSAYKRIDQTLLRLLGRKVIAIGFNGLKPMFTMQISGGLKLRVFSEAGQYSPGWDVSVRAATKKINFAYREDEFQDDELA